MTKKNEKQRCPFCWKRKVKICTNTQTMTICVSNFNKKK